MAAENDYNILGFLNSPAGAGASGATAGLLLGGLASKGGNNWKGALTGGVGAGFGALGASYLYDLAKDTDWVKKLSDDASNWVNTNIGDGWGQYVPDAIKWGITGLGGLVGYGLAKRSGYMEKQANPAVWAGIAGLFTNQAARTLFTGDGLYDIWWEGNVPEGTSRGEATAKNLLHSILSVGAGAKLGAGASRAAATVAGSAMGAAEGTIFAAINSFTDANNTQAEVNRRLLNGGVQNTNAAPAVHVHMPQSKEPKPAVHVHMPQPKEPAPAPAPAEAASAPTPINVDVITPDSIEVTNSGSWVLPVLGAGLLGLGGYAAYKHFHDDTSEQTKAQMRIKGDEDDPYSEVIVNVPIDAPTISDTMAGKLNTGIRRKLRKNIKYNTRKIDPETGKKISYAEWEAKYGDNKE